MSKIAKKPPLHALRCLGALAAMTNSHDGKQRFFKRWDIGVIVYGRYIGVQSKVMAALWTLRLVEPESEEAVALYQYGTCTCGCDRWGITEQGLQAIQDFNVKVPTLRKPGRVCTADDFRKFMEGLFGSPDDPADWWKKGKD